MDLSARQKGISVFTVLCEMKLKKGYELDESPGMENVE